MKTYNYSRQREAIYRFLLHRKDHPTAETIYQHVRQEYPRISLGTIYRNLSLLEETGQIQKVPSGLTAGITTMPTSAVILILSAPAATGSWT